jgi:hypothetical protein
LSATTKINAGLAMIEPSLTLRATTTSRARRPPSVVFRFYTALKKFGSLIGRRVASGCSLEAICNLLWLIAAA